jgi:predicted small lipoprotein YifL
VRTTLILLTVLLGACGQRGPLYFAEPPAKDATLLPAEAPAEDEAQEQNLSDSPDER